MKKRRLVNGQQLVFRRPGEEDSDDDDDEESEAWNAEAHFTNANYQAKKMVLLLFINRERVHNLV